MKALNKQILCAGLASVLAGTLLIGCGAKNDAVSQAEKKDVVNGVPVPSLAETKAIAQEGFTFGLPIVMYYTSTYELFVDKTSSQYKAPVGQLPMRLEYSRPRIRRSSPRIATRRIR